MSKTNMAYSLLKERISSGAYVPGFRLVIDQLARETGISAIPWREAIRRLEAEGWVEMISNVSPRVAMFDTEAYSDTVQIIARLEGYATAASAQFLAPDDIVAMREINQRLVQAVEDFDPARVSELNREFHFAFYERCGNPHLLKLITNEWNRLDLIRRTAFSHVPGRARASVVEHEALLELIEARADFDVIEAAGRQHKLNMLAALEKHRAAADQ